MDDAANILNVLDELVGLPDAQRRIHLDRSGLPGAERSRLERWLTSDQAASGGGGDSGDFLERPPAVLRRALELFSSGGAFEDLAPGRPSDLTGTLADSIDAIAPAPSIPGFEVSGMLGQGGMATVWLARQLSTGRKVALKVVAPWLLASGRHRGRFEREVRLASRLQHPNIARVYDGGSAAGVVYYAMEWIDGEHLDRYVSRNSLNTRQILALMRDVCLAVQHAHQKGIIHRDLKPSNILVNGEGRPHVLDFGLARALDEVAGDRVTQTHAGPFAGTLAFMSPEQASGRSDLLDVRTDVYGLGATLYLLLTGHTPHDTAGPNSVVLRRISETEPRRPRQHRKDLSAELEALLLRAVAFDVEGRYESATALADDIGRYLRGESIEARRPTRVYVLRKWARRHAVPLAVAVCVVAALLSNGIYAYLRVDRARLNALSAEADALAAKVDAVAAQRRAELRAADSIVSEGDALATSNQWLDVVDRYQDAGKTYRQMIASDMRSESGLAVAQQWLRPPLLELVGHHDAVTCTAVLPGDRYVLTGSRDATLRLWELPGGRCVRVFEGHKDWITALAVSADGKRMVSGCRDGRIRIWDIGTGAVIREFFGHSKDVWSLSLSRDGRFLVSTSHDRTTRQWDVQSGYQIRVLSTYDQRVTFSADSHEIWTLSDGRPRRWNADTGASLNDRETGAAGTSIAASPDGQWIACGYRNDGPAIYSTANGEKLRIDPRRAEADVVRFSADSKLLLRYANDHSLRAWDVARQREIATVWARDVWGDPAWASDGGWAITGAQDGVARVWAHLTDNGPEEMQHPTPCSGVAVSPDGNLIATTMDRTNLAGADLLESEVRLWDRATGRMLLRGAGSFASSQCVAFSAVGNLLAFNRGELVYLLDLTRPQSPQPLGYQDEWVRALCFSADGRRLLAATGVGLRMWDLTTGKRLWSAPVVAAVLHPRLAFCRNGAWVGVATERGHAMLYETETGKPVPGVMSEASWHPAPFGVSTFLSDGSSVIATGEQGGVGLFSSFTGRPLRQMNPPRGAGTIAISADDRWGFSGNADKIDIWDIPGGRLVRTIAQGRGAIRMIACSADGKLVATGGEGGTCSVWDFAAPARCREQEVSARAAMTRLREIPDDAAAWATLGEWYAFRKQWAWAALALERARSGGVEISSLALARSYWMTGHLQEAGREFQLALLRPNAPTSYIGLCLAASDGPFRLELTSAHQKAALGQFAAAAVDYDLQVADGPDFTGPYYAALLLKLHRNDVSGYREVSGKMLRKFQNGLPNERDAHFAAQCCLLLPQVTENASTLEAVIQRDLKLNPDSPDSWQAMGLLRLRTGDPQNASEWFARVLKFPTDQAPKLHTLLLQAIASQRLGHSDEAARLLKQAVQAFDVRNSKPHDDWGGTILFRLFRREAEALIEPAE